MNSKKPFLKWAGGKFKLTPAINQIWAENRIETKEKILIEPFVGSGSVFLNSDFKEYKLYDINPDLINLYNLLKEDLSFIDICEELFEGKYNTKDKYLELRAEFNELKDKSDKKSIERRSSLFVYLNRHGFNGLCRYNASGGFNVPFGKYEKPYFPKNEMMNFHTHSKSATIKCKSFENVMNEYIHNPTEEVVFYCDPPYAPLEEQKSNFTTYSKGGFGQSLQEELANLSQELAHKNMTVLLSNHDTELTKRLYEGSLSTTIEVRRNISCDGKNRAKVQEVLAFFNKDYNIHTHMLTK